MHCTVTIFCRMLSISNGVVISLDIGDGAFLIFVFLVDCRFCLICRRRPLVVAIDLGKYLQPNGEMSPGHVAIFFDGGAPCCLYWGTCCFVQVSNTASFDIIILDIFGLPCGGVVFSGISALCCC